MYGTFRTTILSCQYTIPDGNFDVFHTVYEFFFGNCPSNFTLLHIFQLIMSILWSSLIFETPFCFEGKCLIKIDNMNSSERCFTLKTISCSNFHAALYLFVSMFFNYSPNQVLIFPSKLCVSLVNKWVTFTFNQPYSSTFSYKRPNIEFWLVTIEIISSTLEIISWTILILDKWRVF